MSAAGALAITGAVLIVLIALPCAVHAEESRRRTSSGRIGWIALVAGAACLIAAAWTAALS